MFSLISCAGKALKISQGFVLEEYVNVMLDFAVEELPLVNSCGELGPVYFLNVSVSVSDRFANIFVVAEERLVSVLDDFL